MQTHTISIANMTKADEEKVNQALHDVWGVRNIKLNPSKGEVVISYDENAASLVDFQQAIVDCGLELAQDFNSEGRLP